MALEVVDLRCRYSGAATDAVDLEHPVLAPSTTGLVGVNGAGKSTLLATLAGARKPQDGVVSLGEVDLYGPRRRSVLPEIGYMPQALEFPGELSTQDALSYFAWLRGVPAKRAHQVTLDLLDQVGLAARHRDRVSRLSGGMQRRLTFAAALVTSPSVLLLDEPTTGLDPEQRANLRQMINDLPSSTTVLISSHVMEDVEKMTDTVVVLDRGKVLHHGPTTVFVEECGGPDRSAEFAFLATISRADR